MANNTEDIEWVKPLESIVNNLVSNDDYQVKSLLDDLRKLNKLIQQEATRQKIELLDKVYQKRRLIIPNEYESLYIIDANIVKEMRETYREAERRKLEEGK